MYAHHNELLENLQLIFNDITIWSTFINAPIDSQLTENVLAFKGTLTTLVDHVAHISSSVDAVQAPAIQSHVQQARNDITQIQRSLLSLNTVTDDDGSDEQYQDLLLETIVRVYRIVSSTLRNTVAEPCSTVFIIDTLSKKLQQLQDSLTSTLTSATPVVPAPRQPLSAVDPLPRLADGSLDPSVLLTGQSPPIDYNRLYRLSDWSDIYDDTPAIQAAIADANNSTVQQEALLLRHEHPLVIYAQNNFAHQLHRYHNRLKILFSQLYERLSAATPPLDETTNTAVHEHMDSVQTALVTLVQYVSRLTSAIAGTPACALTCNTGLRSIVMLVRQLVICADEYVKKSANDDGNNATAQLLFDVLVTVTRLVALPLQQVNALMDFIELRQSDSALNEHITSTLNTLVAAFGSLEGNRCDANTGWDADAVNAYVRSLDKILRKFRKIRSSTDATLQQLHAIRENVSKVLTTVQYIHGNVVQRGDPSMSIGGGMNVGQLHGHLGRSVQQLRDVSALLNNAVDANVLGGLGDTTANNGRADGNDVFTYVANHGREFVKATNVFHGGHVVESNSTSDTVTRKV